jgi:tRNA(Ile)-lysidine synthase
VKPTSRRLSGRLEELRESIGRPGRLLLAYSGGVDSTVLLHLLGERAQVEDLVAVHVDHGLHPQSGAWAKHCRDTAAALGIEFTCLVATPDLDAGEGVEAAARRARYAAIETFMQADDWVLSAHHADDQAETLLLAMMRGSGPDGLAAMPPARRLGPGWLVRPLLEVTRAALLRCATEAALDWNDDPANAVLDYDRNFLRHEVLPQLAERWPKAARRLARVVERQQDAVALQRAIGQFDVNALGGPARLNLDVLCSLEPARQRNAIRTALRQLELPLPSRDVLEQVLAELVPARPDATPLVAWQGVEVRRYRDHLYLMTTLGPAPGQGLRFEGPIVHLPEPLGTLAIEAGVDATEGLSPELLGSGLEVRWRAGGEGIRLGAGGPTRPLRKLFQERGIVPWMRDRIPLVYASGRLVAVADQWIAADARSMPGKRVVWSGHPPLE